MSNMWFYVMILVSPSGCQSVLCGKNFNVRHHMQVLTILIGTIDFNRFIPLSLSVTLQVQREEKPLGFISLTISSCSE